jgi:hypothetical protein
VLIHRLSRVSSANENCSVLQHHAITSDTSTQIQRPKIAKTLAKFVTGLHCFASSDAIDDLLPLLPPKPAPENIEIFLSPPIGASEDFLPPAVDETDPDPPASCGDPRERSGTFAGDMFLASFFGCIDVRSLAASRRWRLANWHSRIGRVSLHSRGHVPFPGR